MSSKAVNISLISCLLVSTLFCRASAEGKADSVGKDSVLQVYLPREIEVKDDVITLGQVSIIRGEEILVAKASEIALGRISVRGQEIIIDRPIVLSRLACNGIGASQVTLTGAEKITVKQQQQIIKGSEFVELASSFLGENLPTNSVCRWDAIRAPKDLVVSEVSKDIKLSPRLAKSGARNQAKVQISVLAGAKKIGIREVTFRIKHNRRRAVALVDIPAGTILSPENIKIERTLSDYAEPADWRMPYGLVAKRLLPANTVVHPHMVGSVKPAVIAGRNQSVVIRIERPGFLVTAIGRTMQEGRAGEYIKVRNVDSQRVILAKVNKDGTVEPVF
jgi:flagella basal body P-ring formation protein FlgA